MSYSKSLIAAGLLLSLAACDAPPDATIDAGGEVKPRAAPAPPQAPLADRALPAVEGEAGTAVDDLPRWDGVGPATFGMTDDEVRAAWGGELGDSPFEEPGCFHLSPAPQPVEGHFAMMFEAGHFVRYSASSDALTAPGGGRRGMSAAEIETLYPGAVERQPHAYTDGQYLRIVGPEDDVLVFETDPDGTVTQWRVGVPPAVDYIEGCS